jgi:hypothetical protein
MNRDSRPHSRSAGPWTVALVALAAAILLHSLALVHLMAPLDPDECAEALMAMDAIHKGHFIVGWYGQNYMGSHEVYWLAAVCPHADWSTVSVRVAVFVLFAVQLALIAYLAYRFAGARGAVFAMMAACMLTPFAYTWETRARSYQVMPLLMLLALAIETRLVRVSRSPGARAGAGWFAVGALAGAAVWANEIGLVLLFPVLALAAARRRPVIMRILLMLAGALLGFFPRLVYNARDDMAQFKFLAAKIVQISRDEVAAYGLRGALLSHSFDEVRAAVVKYSLVTGPGLILMVSMVLLVLALFIPAVRRRVIEGSRGRLCAGILVSVALCVAVSSRPRYAAVMIPYVVLLVGILAGKGFEGMRKVSRGVAAAMFLGVVISLVSVMRSPAGDKLPPGKELAAHLEAASLTHGISGYDIAHEIMFYSRMRVEASVMGQIPFVPRLNDVERRMLAGGADFVVYDTADTLSRAGRLTEFLECRNVNYECELWNGRFEIFHDFSEPVYPGAYLDGEDEFLFRYLSPHNVRRVNQEKANVLF